MALTYSSGCSCQSWGPGSGEDPQGLFLLGWPGGGCGRHQAVLQAVAVGRRRLLWELEQLLQQLLACAAWEAALLQHPEELPLERTFPALVPLRGFVCTGLRCGAKLWWAGSVEQIPAASRARELLWELLWELLASWLAVCGRGSCWEQQEQGWSRAAGRENFTEQGAEVCLAGGGEAAGSQGVTAPSPGLLWRWLCHPAPRLLLACAHTKGKGEEGACSVCHAVTPPRTPRAAAGGCYP